MPNNNLALRQIYEADAGVFKRFRQLVALRDDCVKKALDVLFFAMNLNVKSAYSDAVRPFLDMGTDAFAVLMKLNKMYGDIMKLEPAFKGAILSKHLTGLLENIFSIIGSRRRSMELRAPFLPDTESPIQSEGHEIIERYQRSLNNNMQMLAKRFIYNYFVSGNDSFNLSIQGLVGDALDSSFGLVYKAYAESVYFCVMNFSDLSKRKLLGYYSRALAEEKRLIDTTIAEKIAQLTREAEHAFILSDYKKQLQNLIELLNTASDTLNTECNHLLTTLPNQERGQHYYESAIMPETALRTMLEKAVVEYAGGSTSGLPGMIEDYNVVLKSSQNAIDAYIKERLRFSLAVDQYRLEQDALYELNRQARMFTGVAESMMAAFARITTFYDNHAAMFEDSSQFEIIKGVSESISIKNESIKENLDMFMEETQPIIAALSESDAEVPEDIIESLFATVRERIYNTLSQTATDDRRQLAVIRKTFAEILSADTTKDKLEALEKRRQHLVSGMRKKTENFLRDSLLFEVSTFEEINHYSVSRLLESEDEHVLEFARLNQECLAEVDNILTASDIEPIRPKPFDAFNGREHEVLMAEKQEGFKKGQIIKLMNSGYRYGESILIRANVIAAK